jgi:hypothetical protein
VNFGYQLASKSLSYPRDLARLPEVVAAIISNLHR